MDTNGVNDDDDVPELALGLNFTLPDTITARLGFISVTAENCLDGMPGCTDAPSAAAPLFAGAFGIDLTSPDANGELTLADLGDSSFDELYDVKLSADLALDWLLKAAPGDDVGFPGVQAQFVMGWHWDDAAVDTGLPTVEFKNVGIDAGAVFSEILGPVLNKIKQVTGPLDPVIKTLYAPIPVLSDLSHLVGGDDVTIVSIAKAYSTLSGGPDLTFIDTIAGLVQFIESIPDCTSDCFIPIGAFTMDGDALLNSPATPGQHGESHRHQDGGRRRLDVQLADQRRSRARPTPPPISTPSATPPDSRSRSSITPRCSSTCCSAVTST